MFDKYLVFEAFRATLRIDRWLADCTGKERREEKGSHGAASDVRNATRAS